jgi:hypothetical protein
VDRTGRKECYFPHNYEWRGEARHLLRN